MNFQLQKPLFKSISPTFLNPDLTKQIPLNPAHQDLSNSTKGTLQLLHNFQLQFNLIFSEEIIQYIQELLHGGKSKRHGTNPMHSSLTAFQRDQEHDLKHPSSMDLITTKQNKLPSFIDRLVWPVPLAKCYCVLN